MDKSIIRELVFSGKCYADKINMSDNETYTKSCEELEQKLKKLCEGMSKTEKYNTMWDFSSLQADIEIVTSEDYFIEGFKLGMRIAVQSLLD